MPNNLSVTKLEMVIRLLQHAGSVAGFSQTEFLTHANKDGLTLYIDRQIDISCKTIEEVIAALKIQDLRAAKDDADELPF